MMAPHYHHHLHPPQQATHDALVQYTFLCTLLYLWLLRLNKIYYFNVYFGCSELWTVGHHSCPIMLNSLEWCIIVQDILQLMLHHDELNLKIKYHYAQFCQNNLQWCTIFQGIFLHMFHSRGTWDVVLWPKVGGVCLNDLIFFYFSPYL